MLVYLNIQNQIFVNALGCPNTGYDTLHQTDSSIFLSLKLYFYRNHNSIIITLYRRRVCAYKIWVGNYIILFLGNTEKSKLLATCVMFQMGDVNYSYQACIYSLFSNETLFKKASPSGHSFNLNAMSLKLPNTVSAS